MNARDSAAVTSAVSLLMATICGIALAVASCSRGPAQAPRSFSARDAVMILSCNVADAEVWVDERFIGQVNLLRGGFPLAPGLHRVEVRHHLHHTQYIELELQAKERRALEVELIRVLP